ncbi:hypothetical protein ACFQVA_09565 [Actinomadura keratinilytica]
MLYTKKLIGLAAVGVLLASCGSSDSDSAGAAEGAPAKGAGQESPAAGQKVLPVALDGSRGKVLERGAEELKVTPKPENGAPFAEQVEHKLRETVLGTAKVPGKTSATCPDGVTLKAGAVSSCEATYEGATIPYEVKISDSYKEGGFLAMYNTKAGKGLLVAEAVYEEFWQRFGGLSRPIRRRRSSPATRCRGRGGGARHRHRAPVPGVERAREPGQGRLRHVRGADRRVRSGLPAAS